MPHNKAKIAELVRAGRLAKGYTQLELSELTRISLRSIQRIENGDVAPRLYTLNLLADQLGFDPGFASVPDKVPENKIISVEPVKMINRPRRLVISFGSGLLLLLASAAFLSQTRRFPETNFESFGFWAVVVLAYALTLWRIWK